MALNVNQYMEIESLILNSMVTYQESAGHAIRHSELPLSKVILWKPVHGHIGKGRPRATL